MKTCNCKDKNWRLVCDNCGGNLPSCLDCTDTERRLKEARAEIERLSEALSRSARRNGSDGRMSREAIEKRDAMIKQMREVLEDITTGVVISDYMQEHGYACILTKRQVQGVIAAKKLLEDAKEKIND